MLQVSSKALQCVVACRRGTQGPGIFLGPSAAASKAYHDSQGGPLQCQSLHMAVPVSWLLALRVSILSEGAAVVYLSASSWANYLAYHAAGGSLLEKMSWLNEGAVMTLMWFYTGGATMLHYNDAGAARNSCSKVVILFTWPTKYRLFLPLLWGCILWSARGVWKLGVTIFYF